MTQTESTSSLEQRMRQAASDLSQQIGARNRWYWHDIIFHTLLDCYYAGQRDERAKRKKQIQGAST